jgi:DNA-binding transcriptional MocR family regulator
LWSALRVGWLRAPAPTIGRLVARKAALDLATPALDQALVLHCLPHLEPIAAQRRHGLRQAREQLRHRLRADLPHWHDETDNAGPFLWLRTHLDDADPIIQTAATAGVRLTAGRTLSTSERWNGHVRVAVTAPQDTLDAAVDRLANALTNGR